MYCIKSLKIFPYLLAADVLRDLAGLLAAAAAAPVSPSLGTTLGIPNGRRRSERIHKSRFSVSCCCCIVLFLVDLRDDGTSWEVCVGLLLALLFVLIRGVFFERKGFCNTYPYLCYFEYGTYIRKSQSSSAS